MEFINFFLTYNWIFKCYLLLLLIFNIFMFYNFIFVSSNTIENTKIYINNDIIDIHTKYNMIFKKLIKISKNPIIFEYQLEQINKILQNTDKYIKCQRDIYNINYSENKNISVYKNYKKIKKILLKRKILNVNEIIIKLICINFL
jgi:hypothetical protein